MLALLSVCQPEDRHRASAYGCLVLLLWHCFLARLHIEETQRRWFAQGALPLPLKSNYKKGDVLPRWISVSPFKFVYSYSTRSFLESTMNNYVHLRWLGGRWWRRTGNHRTLAQKTLGKFRSVNGVIALTLCTESLLFCCYEKYLSPQTHISECTKTMLGELKTNHKWLTYHTSVIW